MFRHKIGLIAAVANITESELARRESHIDSTGESESHLPVSLNLLPKGFLYNGHIIEEGYLFKRSAVRFMESQHEITRLLNMAATVAPYGLWLNLASEVLYAER